MSQTVASSVTDAISEERCAELLVEFVRVPSVVGERTTAHPWLLVRVQPGKNARARGASGSRTLRRRRDLGRLGSCGEELLEQGVVSFNGHEVEAPVDEQVVEAVDAGLDDDVWLLG